MHKTAELQCSLPVYDLKQWQPTTCQSIIKSELIYRHRVLPLYRDANNLYVGIVDPADQIILNMLSFHTDLRIRFMLVEEKELNKIIDSYYRPDILYTQLESTLAKIPQVKDQDDTQNNQQDEPIAAFVTKLLQDAVDKNVSDIHIEPAEQQCRLRFRCNGLLSEAALLPLHLAARVVTRLKIMADLNIAERRLPQDGRIQLQKKPKIDIRVNTCPTLYGEKMVLRLLKTNHIDLNLDNLGFTSEQQQLFMHALNQPQGLILVTGPTGSGKTITLYSALHYLNQIEKNISSVEDPVEIELPGINQININPKIGLDFAAVLRTLLRQDPDIIMVGEIRDLETASIAMQASQTGHLVLSTLHTNSAVDTLTRLQSMGIASHNLINSISLIIAQRLIRQLCNYCKQLDKSSSFYQPIGCEHCHQGYQGRVGIFELLPITSNITPLLLSGVNAINLKESLTNEINMTLAENAWEKVHNGCTSYAELVRVLGI